MADTTHGAATPAAAAGPITLRKSGTLLEISSNGRADATAALPGSVRQLLEPVLQYQHKRFLYGAERRDPISGIDRRVEITDKQLYRYDQFGRMVTGFGFAKRILALLKANYFETRCLTVVGEREQQRDHVRPRAYEFRPELIERHFTYRDRQADAVRAAQANPCGVMAAATGFGKLVLIVMIALAFPHAVIHVITRRKALIRKMHAYLTRYIPNVGLIGDGVKQMGQRVTVVSSGSLHHAQPWDADIILCDEAHELLAEESSRFLAKYDISRNFAFTASPEGRADGTDIRMESLFGPVIFHLPYWEAVRLDLVVPIRVEWCDVRLDYNPAADKSDVSKKRWGLWRNAERNQIIADKANTFGAEDQVLILVNTIEHAVHLRQHLPNYTLVYGANEIAKKDKYLSHEMATEEDLTMTPRKLDEMRVRFESGELKKVISTGVWAVGIDPVQLTVLIRADPGSSEIMDVQAPGRVSRRIFSTPEVLTTQPGSKVKDYGVVVDFRDQFDSAFAQAAKKRFSHYKAMRWEQMLVTDKGPVPLARL